MKQLVLRMGLSLVLVACVADEVSTEPADNGGDTGSGGDNSSSDSSSSSADSSSASTGTGGAPSTGSGGPGDTSGELTFLCYNVHGLPSVVTGDDTPGRMSAIAPLLNDFDVVALQEDFAPENHATLVNASTLMDSDWFDAKVDPGRVYGAGLSLFSNPLQIETQQTHYTECNGIFDGANDCLSSKGFQMVRLQVGAGAEIDVYNTHLDAGGGSGDDDARAAQVDQLLASLNTTSAGRAVVVMGDMNLEEDDPDEAPTLFHLIDDGTLLDSCDTMTCNEPGRIERIMFRGSDTVSLTVQSWTNEPAFENGGSPLSDHPAISATFAWATLTP
jgi:endonuclease/exonuclease/phosphatase family metal-dependent hydrolase